LTTIKASTLDPRGKIESTAAARYAGVARSLVIRMARCSLCRRDIPPDTPDYADFRSALDPYVHIEELKARLAEAKLTKNNQVRIAELNGELGAAYLVASKAAGAK
jgi:hypothetical protein